MRRTLALKPDDKGAAEDVINREAWLADAYVAAGDIAAAAQHRDAQAHMLAALIAADPRNRDLQDTWLTSQIALAALEEKQKRRDAARSRLVSALSVADQIVAFDPANKQWRQRRETIAARLALLNLVKTGGQYADQ